MSATAALTISCTMSGLPESAGSTNVGFISTFSSTQAVGEWRTTQVTTVAANMPVINLPSSASAIYLLPIDSTNTFSYRVCATSSTGVTTAAGGLTLSSLGPSFITVNPAATSRYYLWTTETSGAGGSAPTINVRVGII